MALLIIIKAVKLVIEKRKIAILLVFDFCLKHLIATLTERTQTIKCTDKTPMRYRPVAMGFRQGSVLIQLLIRSLYKWTLFQLFWNMDNTQIYRHAYPSELDKAIDFVKKDSQVEADWVLRNGLELNEWKTKAIIVGSMQYTDCINLATTNKTK